MTLREKILNSRAMRTELVRIAALDVEVEVHELRAGEALDLQSSARDADGKIDQGRLAAVMIIAATFDPESKTQLFRSADRDALLELGVTAFTELASHAGRLNAANGAADEGLEKNSATPEVTSDTPTAFANASGG